MTALAARPLTAADLWSIPRVGAPVPSPDGAFVIAPVTTYVEGGDEPRTQLHLLRTASPGEPRALTAPDASSSEPAVSPDGERLAFVRKPPGGEHGQLHVMPLDGGEARCVSSLPLGVTDPRWMPDGKRVLVLALLYRGALTPEATARLRDERKKAGPSPHVTEDRVYRFWDRWLTSGEVHHVFVIDVATGAATDLTPDSERWFDLMDPSGEYDVSPDGAEIAFSANSSVPPHRILRNAIFTVPLSGGPVRCLTPDNPADDKRPRYTPDGRFLVYGAKRNVLSYADRVRLVRVDRRTGEHVTLTEGWDRSPSGWELAGPDTLVIEAESEGRTCLYRLSASAGGTPELVARGGTLHGIRPASDGFVYVQHSTMSRPPEVARVPVAGGSAEILSRFTAQAMEGIALGRAEELEIEGAGGDRVHVHVVYPPGHEDGRRWPLVHSIHGGPYGIHADAWHWRWNAQTFAAAGRVVAMVNFHGSSSYGQRFADAILGDWGGKAAEDILRATDALVARGVADPKRMAIIGGSFGGYMTCWLATRTDRFACAVAHAAVYNLAASCAADVTQGIELELGGEHWSLPEAQAALDRWDPAAHTGSYRTPTLVTHGERDYRVPVQQALEAYGMLQAKGVPARLVYYPDENHWILKRRNSLHWYGEVHAWLARWLDAP